MPGKYARKMVGQRCYLAPLEPDDYRLFAQWVNDPEVSVNLCMLSQTISTAKEREIMESLSKSGHHYTIVELATDRPIGACSLDSVDPVNRCADAGIFIGDKEFWSRGYGTEAMCLLLDFGFSILNLENVMLQVHSFNTRAIRAYEKVGFREIGHRRRSRIIAGRRYDEILMDILAEEFTGGPLRELVP